MSRFKWSMMVFRMRICDALESSIQLYNMRSFVFSVIQKGGTISSMTYEVGPKTTIGFSSWRPITSLSASTKVFYIHLETWFLNPVFFESSESGIGILNLSNCFSTFNVLKTTFSIWVVSFGWFNGRIIVVWVSNALVWGSIVGGSLGVLPWPGVGIRSYLLFSSEIRNLEKAWYLETYEDPWSY